MKIYTKTGDDGSTSLFGGERVPKHALRIETYGAVDELNASLGIVVSGDAPDDIVSFVHRIQNELFILGADLAAPMGLMNSAIVRIGAEDVTWIESTIDAIELKLKPISFFILPGGSELACRLHLARTICRRAERFAVSLAEQENINPMNVQYLNRLSDFLFVLARDANRQAGIEDCRWVRPNH